MTIHLAPFFVIQAWLNLRNPQEAEIIMNYFKNSFPDVLRYAVQSLIFKMDVLEAFIIRQACDLLEGLIPTKDEKDSSILPKAYYERLYVFTLMWSIGAFLELDDRTKMEEFLRRHDKIKLDLPDIPHDSDASIFDYLVDSNGKITYY